MPWHADQYWPVSLDRVCTGLLQKTPMQMGPVGVSAGVATTFEFGRDLEISNEF